MTLLWLIVWAIAGAPSFNGGRGWGLALVIAIVLEALGS